MTKKDFSEFKETTRDVEIFKPASPSVEPKTVEEWAVIKETKDWLFASAKAIGPWAIGTTLTEEAYDAAIVRAGGLKINPA